MTRRKAIAIVAQFYPHQLAKFYSTMELHTIASAQVDTLAALGILKLDESVNPAPTAQEAFIESLARSHWTASGIAHRLKQLGMKVVKDE